MTILEAGAKLYDWYNENDAFNLDDDFQRIVLVTDTPNRDRAAFVGALKDFEKIEMVESHQVEEKVYWVLKRPFSTFPQTISISPEMTMTITGIINKFCEMTGDKTEICDPLNLTEADIKKVMYIANVMMQKDVDEVKDE